VNILNIKTDTTIVWFGYSLVLSLRIEHTFREYQYKLLTRIFETSRVMETFPTLSQASWYLTTPITLAQDCKSFLKT